MLSSFLPPVPSLPSDPPEHFPLRKTGAWDRPAGTSRGKEGPWMRVREGGLAGRGTVCTRWAFSLALPSLASLREDWEGGRRPETGVGCVWGVWA